MEELLQYISRIQNKLLGVQKQMLQLTREKEKLAQELKQFTEQDQILKSRIETLEKQVELSKAFRPEMSLTDKQALEKRINQYLREIDKCIALLNE